MTTQLPPKPKSMTVAVPKVQSQTRVFLIAQRMPSVRQFQLLPVPIGGTILMTSPRRLRACGLQTLTEVTFRPHFLYCCSFTAVIRDGCAERGVSFSYVVRLIASIGHVGKIDDFTIKPIEQHSFLLTGFSRHTLSRPSFGGTTLSTAAEAGYDHVNATRTRP
jgi:hypothetical protein